MIGVLTNLVQEHDLRLVLIAVLICGVACFASLTLLSRGIGAESRWVWLPAGALAFGSGTWAAHFISMLAFAPHMPMGFDMRNTLLSILVGIAGSAAGLSPFQKPRRTWIDIGVVAVALGCSVGAMHLVGMGAVLVAGHLRLDPVYIAAALVIGAVLFGAARWFVVSVESMAQRLVGGGILALGILALHFTAMGAVTIEHDPSMPMAPSLVDTQPLAIGIAAVGLVILAFGLVAARFDQQAVLQSERELARFRQLTDATFSGVFVYRDNIILDVNAALCSFMGCEPSDLIGHTVGSCVAPEYRERLAERIRAGQLENAEFDVIIKSGARRTVEVITRIVDYRGGKASVIALRDITDRKRDDLLRAEEHRILTDIAENQPLDQTVAAVCRVAEAAMPEAICSVLLVTPEGTLQTVAGPQLPPEYSAAIDGAPIGPKAGSCGTAAHRGQMVVVEDIATDPLWEDYKHIALKYGLRACWSVPLIAKNGRVLGTFATYHDRPYRPHPLDLAVIDRLASYMAIAIQRSQLHADLIAARDHAEAASQAKSQFLANMSHELRTPLNAILGFSEIIANQSFGPDAQQRYIEYATDIHDSGEYLLSLINDVLDVARVEAGKVRINRQHCTVAATIEEQLRFVRRAYPGSARIAVQIGAGCPDLLVDHRAFGQILINVVGNACKFTPQDGQITISCDWQDQGLRLLVSDTGPGIPANMIEEMGKPFRQVESAYSRRHSGTGLGLYISRSLMRLHGGNLEINSALGRGTTVTLAFPEDCVLREVGLQQVRAAGE
jgi:PAS domain S-box-containing protein